MASDRKKGLFGRTGMSPRWSVQQYNKTLSSSGSCHGRHNIDDHSPVGLGLVKGIAGAGARLPQVDKYALCFPAPALFPFVRTNHRPQLYCNLVEFRPARDRDLTLPCLCLLGGPTRLRLRLRIRARWSPFGKPCRSGVLKKSCVIQYHLTRSVTNLVPIPRTCLRVRPPALLAG